MQTYGNGVIGLQPLALNFGFPFSYMQIPIPFSTLFWNITFDNIMLKSLVTKIFTVPPPFSKFLSCHVVMSRRFFVSL